MEAVMGIRRSRHLESRPWPQGCNSEGVFCLAVSDPGTRTCLTTVLEKVLASSKNGSDVVMELHCKAPLIIVSKGCTQDDEDRNRRGFISHLRRSNENRYALPKQHSRFVAMWMTEKAFAQLHRNYAF